MHFAMLSTIKHINEKETNSWTCRWNANDSKLAKLKAIEHWPYVQCFCVETAKIQNWRWPNFSILNLCANIICSCFWSKMRRMNKLMRWPFISHSCKNQLATENEPRVKWTAVRFWNRGTTIHKRSSMTHWKKKKKKKKRRAQKIWKKILWVFFFFFSFPTYPAFGVKNDAHNIAFKMTNQFYVCARLFLYTIREMVGRRSVLCSPLPGLPMMTAAVSNDGVVVAALQKCCHINPEIAH